ncbi:MAG TPA: glycosyltransferase 87 family protein, partial [Ktedonobacteraceae bacterium]|nr:glycosyltransferase 87 family protein [Ktedonobacteraceae bacterium]
CLNEIAFAGVQAIREGTYQGFPIVLKDVCVIVPVLLIVGSFYAMWMAFRPSTHVPAQGYPARWQRLMLIVSIGLALVGAVVCGIGFVKCFLPLEFSNDGTVLDINAASALLRGQNPYSNPTLSGQARNHEDWTTPLRLGQFKGRLDYPTRNEMRRVLDADLASGHSVEFESKVSYPAFSFLTLVPFAFFKHSNVLPLYLLSHLLLIVAAWYWARPGLRPWILLLAFANVSTWTATAGETLDMLYTLFIGLAWLFGGKRWWSAVFLGLAIASKQIAWFFVPFYFIMIWQQYSWKEAIGRLLIVGGLGLAINAPFMVWDLQAWYAGVMAPIADPMFPLGTGIINLSIGHLIPYFPEWCYKFLQWGTYAAALAYYWFRCRKCPEAVMLLAVLPLFFAWRSLPSYFYCSAFPLLALLLARQRASESLSTSVPEVEPGPLKNALAQ